MRGSRKVMLAAAVVACAVALLVSAGTASSYPAGSGEDRLATARAELIALRGTLVTPSARLWLSRSVASLGWTVGADCWDFDGSRVAIPSTAPCVDAIRVTLNRLVAGDPSGELGAKAHPQILEIVDVAKGWALNSQSYAASGRDLSVAGGPERLWLIEHDIAQGDRDLPLDPRWALNDYLRAADRWAGPAGADPASTVLGAHTVQPKVDYNPAGSAEAFQVQANGSLLTRLSLYVDPASTATSLVAGIYADGEGGPGQLLAQGSTPLAVGGGDWNTVHVPHVTLTPGATYWVAILAPAGAGTLRFRDRCCRGGGTTATVMSAETALASLPAAWSSGRPFKDGPLSFFGSN